MPPLSAPYRDFGYPGRSSAFWYPQTKIVNPFATIPALANSLHLAVGLTLFTVVWQSCEKADAVLNENAKLEIAIWLLGLRLTPKATVRGSLVLSFFRAIFGTPESRKRIIIAGVLAIVGSILIGLSTGNHSPFRKSLIETIHFAVLLVFFGLGIGANEYAISYPSKVWAALVSMAALALMVAEGITAIALWFGVSFERVVSNPHLPAIIFRVGIVPAIVASIWIWLPWLTRLTVKITRRLDAVFAWLNKRFDIEKSPVKSIGLVSGVLVAVTYWAVVIVGRLI